MRIAAGEHAAELLLWPVIERLLPDYPDITIEIVIDNGLADIVEQRLDAGVRLGQQVAKDMVAVRIGPDVRMAVVATPAYFSRHTKPKTPQDLTAHNCINIRLPTAGGIYAWEFRKGGRELNVRVEGQLVFNTATMAVKAALAGVGLAFVPEQRVLSQLESGELLPVLSDWCPSFSGFHLYYPSRRQPTPAFVVAANALRQGAKASGIKRNE
ncbi:LysR substrate-binding domain-containing protein [Caballeronia sp. Lep1P3]|uniref:LysR substrate-binding domain-containing protein n=1 Tax=Caballeronia sp. Lep1P3 TaxID=2878150 RepID=UPI00351D75BE